MFLEADRINQRKALMKSNKLWKKKKKGPEINESIFNNMTDVKLNSQKAKTHNMGRRVFKEILNKNFPKINERF